MSRSDKEQRPAGSVGQGDDLADRLGGGEGRAMPMTPGQAASGHAGPIRSEGSAAEPAAVGAGEPGGMGGATAGGTRHDSPPGGVSPIEPDDGSDER